VKLVDIVLLSRPKGADIMVCSIEDNSGALAPADPFQGDSFIFRRRSIIEFYEVGKRTIILKINKNEVAQLVFTIRNRIDDFLLICTTLNYGKYNKTVVIILTYRILIKILSKLLPKNPSRTCARTTSGFLMKMWCAAKET